MVRSRAWCDLLVEAESTSASRSLNDASLSRCDRTFGSCAGTTALRPGASSRRPGNALRSGDRERASTRRGLIGRAVPCDPCVRPKPAFDAPEGLALGVALGRGTKDTRGVPDQPNMPEVQKEMNSEAKGYVEPAGDRTKRRGSENAEKSVPVGIAVFLKFDGRLVKYARFCVSIGFAVFPVFWLSVGVWFGTHP